MLKNNEFKDVYSLVKSKPRDQNHPKFTTYKYRQKEGWVKRTIDYIFVLNNSMFYKQPINVQ